MSQFRIVRTVSATVLLAGAVSFSFAGTASAQNQFNCSEVFSPGAFLHGE
jgi:hypothetical protein